MVTVNCPNNMRGCFEGRRAVEVNGETLGEVFEILGEAYPTSRWHFLSADGELHEYLNVYLNGEDVRHLEGLATAVTSGDRVDIVPTGSGG